MRVKSLKRKCKVCGTKFGTMFFNRWWCSPECGVELAQKTLKKQREKAAKKRQKEESAKIKQIKESMKSMGDLIKEAQSAVNKYIRLRDENKPCISCGKHLTNNQLGGGFDAGHFRSRGSAPHLRFYTLNIFGQCKRCNRYLGGNYQQFRIGLIDRIGVEKVEEIEADQYSRNYSKDDLRRIKQIFNKKCRLIEKRRGLK
ncbi:recombination protein NinG [Aggregatibacter actinomycetemcomitans]|uniref:recombination protein NinG n=1 Tax=Aggregatibacter actinomycetemcomitans TaxID=714 RepID=UPI00197B9783|nr:recombination protein NinG [Aggregatibacter actinomycetemcomitans]MBN6069427.1 recombination protein NinG [Aggregatibacter actinomycetemcomitans]MBN6087089.1 recombination protein NinG [Aggregatibacter actinomycetemcomitans]